MNTIARLFSQSRRECHLKSFPQGFWVETKMLKQRLGTSMQALVDNLMNESHA